MKIVEIIELLENISPTAYQESYDNAGLLLGDAGWDCTGILCSLDTTEAVIEEARLKNCNLIVAHHPVIFNGLKKINGKNYVEKAVIKAIKHDIAVYATHTNLDNMIDGVNKVMADKLGLQQQKILQPKAGTWMKLNCFVPREHEEALKQAIFDAGAGEIGAYSACSFSAEGTGQFKIPDTANPFIGKPGDLQHIPEIKVEIVFPAYLQRKIVTALKAVHPYEEPAYDLITLSNENESIGSGIIAELPEPLPTEEFLRHIKAAFGLQAIKHTAIHTDRIRKVALCGGSGSFLIKKAIAAGADLYITSDVKYHEFFDAEGRMIIADIGHWESEQFTVDLLIEILQANFPTFAVLKSGVRTNPVYFFL